MSKEKFFSILLACLTGLGSVIYIYDFFYQKKILDNPNWVIEIKPNEKNLIHDLLEIKSKNSNINIQQFNVFIKGDRDIIKFESKKGILITSELKAELSKFIESKFSLKSIFPSQYAEFSVPVLIYVRYEYLGESKENYRIYNYKFRYYTVGEYKNRIRSMDYFFVKEVYSFKNAKNELILVNLNCCLKEDFGPEEIAFELAEIDKNLDDLLKLYEDSKLYTQEIIVEDENNVSNDSVTNLLKVYYFSFTSDSVVTNEWLNRIYSLKGRKLNFNFKINSSVDSLEKIFNEYKVMKDINISDQNKILQLFVNELNFFGIDSNRNFYRWKNALNGVYDGMIEYKYKEFSEYFKE